MRAPRTGAPARAAKLGRGTAWLLLFAFFTALGVVLHVNLPGMRAALGELLERSLRGQFRGALHIDGLAHVGWTGLEVRRLELLDTAGRSVLSLEGIKLRYEPLALASRLLLPSHEPLRIEHLRVDHSRVVLALDPSTGRFTLVDALAPARTGPKRAPTAAQPSLYALDAIELGAVAIDVSHPALGELSARVQRLQASAELGGADTAVSVQRFGVQLFTRERLLLDGTGALRMLPRGVVGGAFHGFVDGTEIDVSAERDGELLRLRADVPRAAAVDVRRRIPEWPFDDPVSAHIEAEGPPDALAVSAQLTADPMRVDVAGLVNLLAGPSAHLTVDAKGIDPSAVLDFAPVTPVAARAAVDIALGGPSVQASIEGSAGPLPLGAVQLSNVAFSMSWLDGDLSGSLRVADPRARLEATLALSGGILDLSAAAEDLDLDALLGSGGALGGRIDAVAHAQLADGRVDGELQARSNALRLGAARLGQTEWVSTFGGAPEALEEARIETALSARDIDLAGVRFESGRVTSSGTARRSRVSAELARSGGGRATALGELTLTPPIALSDVELRWNEAGLDLAAHVRHFAPARSTLELDAFQLTGAQGTATGALSLAPGRLRSRLDVQHIEVADLARTLGVAAPAYRGRLSGHAELDAGGGASGRGSARLQAERSSYRDVPLGNVELVANLDGRTLELELQNSTSPFGTLGLAISLEAGGPVLRSQSWQRATGRASATLDEVPLWPLGAALGQRARVRDLSGTVDLSLRAERTDPSAAPDIAFEAATNALAFRVEPPRARQSGHGTGAPSEGRLYDRFALRATAAVDGATRAGNTTVMLADDRGELLSANGATELDLLALINSPRAALERLRRAPVNALVRLHPRPLALLPPPLSLEELSGTVEASLAVSGSALDPELSFALTGTRLMGGLAQGAPALDLATNAHYRPSSGALLGEARVSQGQQTLVSARVEGAVPSPLSSASRAIRTDLRAAAMLNGVPLELWPAAARERLTARLYGSVDVEQRGERRRERAHIEIEGLTAQGHALGNGRFTLRGSGDDLRGELRIGSTQRHLRARIERATSASGSAGLRGSLAARNFDAASLSPLVGGILSRVAGDVDADLKFEAYPEQGDDWYLGIDGTATLESGSAHVDLLGLEVRDISAEVRARSTPDYSVILINPLAAKARSRTPNLRGDAELWLDGLRVVNGEANLSLNEVPLSLEGASQGTARGRVRAWLDRKPDHLALQVQLPELRVRLPRRTGRSLISLEPNAEIVAATGGREEPPPNPDADLWKMEFQLGDAVRIQRSDLDVPLTGTPRLEYRHEVRPSGIIEALPGGRVDLFGRSFSIDHAVVELVPEEPDNPRVDVTASWRAPDGTTVYVDVTGRADDASVLTRDDRGLEDVERFYLLTGNTLAPSSDAIAFADSSGGDAAALGQTFALGINELLRESIGNVAVSIGTTPDDRASYSASVRLSDKLTFQGHFQPASETRPEESTNDLTGTLDYQFSRNWSLRTELGTSGGAFDILWSYRY